MFQANEDINLSAEHRQGVQGKAGASAGISHKSRRGTCSGCALPVGAQNPGSTASHCPVAWSPGCRPTVPPGHGMGVDAPSRIIARHTALTTALSFFILMSL